MIRNIFALLFVLCAVPALAGGVADDAWSIRPVLVGSPAPAFSAISADGSEFKFTPGALERPVVIIFYRGGWCPYCNLHWAELRKIEDELLAMDIDMIFLSADQPSVLAEAMQEDKKPRYHLLSDNSTAIAQQFGIAFQVSEAEFARLLDMGHDLEAASGMGHHILPTPAVFIIGSDGLIKFSFITPEYRVRLHNSVLLAAIRTMPGWRLRKPEPAD